MPSWIVPSDTHVIADTGHTTDHDHIADDLTLVATAFPGVTTGAASTAHNTLDDGSGNATFAGNVATSGTLTATATGTVSGAHEYGSIVTDGITVLGNSALSGGNPVVVVDDGTGSGVWLLYIDHTNHGFGFYDNVNSRAPFVLAANGGMFSLNNTLDDGSGNMTVTGALNVSTVGKGLKVAEGSNAKQGTLTLNGTTAVVVSNTSVTANSRVFLTIQSPGGTVGSPYVSARTAGTSFSVKSTVSGDTSTCAYFITEPG